MKGRERKRERLALNGWCGGKVRNASSSSFARPGRVGRCDTDTLELEPGRRGERRVMQHSRYHASVGTTRNDDRMDSDGAGKLAF